MKAFTMIKALAFAAVAAALYTLVSPGTGLSPLPSLAQTAKTAPEEASREKTLGDPKIIKRAPLPDIRPGTLDMEILRDIEKRKEELNLREEDLDKREQRLNSLQADIEKQLSELMAVQAKIDESMELRNDLEKTAIAKLAKTYASMPPAAAAKLIQQIDNAIAIRILRVMKERSAGRILAVTPPALATKLSEGLVKKR